jgi:hypothetical protein
MATELETNIRTALEKLAKALADAAEMTVETRYKVVDPANPEALENGVLAARTTIKLDGDHEAIVPVTGTETGSIIIEDALLDFHLRNVQAAIEYRRGALETLVNIGRRRGL